MDVPLSKVGSIPIPPAAVNHADQWYGAATSARVPVTVINKLNADIVAAVKSPDVAQRLAADGSTAVGSSVEQFSAKIRAETAMWRKLAKETGLVLK
jgi:tripartite-type tricarboxylate transporter receptor subunit TctC